VKFVFTRDQYIKGRGVKAAEDNKRLIAECDGKPAEKVGDGTYHINVGDYGWYVTAGVVEVDDG
jgi:hypothetical protein